MSNTISSKITPVRVVTASIVILVAAAIWGWYSLVYISPSAVFDRMLYNTLSTPGLYKSTSQADNGQPPVEQRTQVVTSPMQRARSIVVLHQGADGSTVITTESIGTTDADYVRYTDFKTTEKTAQGKNFDFSSVLGIWGKADGNDPSSGGAQLYNQTVLDVLPVGNLTANQRQALLKQIKDDQIYSVDYSNVKKSKQSGRPVYTYDVKVRVDAYVSLLKAFADDIGLNQLKTVDPTKYADREPLKFTFDVDIWSGEPIKITYADQQQTEVLGSFGIRSQIDVPKQSVPVLDLESRLQQIQ